MFAEALSRLPQTSRDTVSEYRQRQSLLTDQLRENDVLFWHHRPMPCAPTMLATRTERQATSFTSRVGRKPRVLFVMRYKEMDGSHVFSFKQKTH